MGPWRLWCGVGVPLLLPNFGPEHRPATVGPTRCNSSVASQATARSHAALQRTHPRPDAPSGLVIAHLIVENLERFVLISARTGNLKCHFKWTVSRQIRSKALILSFSSTDPVDLERCLCRRRGCRCRPYIDRNDACGAA